MRAVDPGLAAHLEGGATTLCRCWRLQRRDGRVMGFTDHDRDLEFDGALFRASTGVNTATVETSTGLSVDNSQAVGVLNDLGLEEADIRAGAESAAAMTLSASDLKKARKPPKRRTPSKRRRTTRRRS